MLQLASTATLTPTSIVFVGAAAATAEGLLAYDKQTTPPALARIIEAQATPKVRELTDYLLDNLLIGEIENAARRLGHKNSATDALDVNMMAKDVAQVLRLNWGYFTEGELREVFFLGSMRQLRALDKDGKPDAAEVVSISSAGVGEWLLRYKYQVKTKAMAHAQRLAYQSSELPRHHPVHAAWRIARVVALAGLSPEALRQLSPREGDFKNLLFQWLKEIGALGFRAKPLGFWERLEALDKQRLRRAGQFPKEEDWLAMATGHRETYAERLTAAKRWRTLCLWLTGHRQRGTDLADLLTPLATALYTPPTL